MPDERDAAFDLDLGRPIDGRVAEDPAQLKAEFEDEAARCGGLRHVLVEYRPGDRDAQLQLDGLFGHRYFAKDWASIPRVDDGRMHIFFPDASHPDPGYREIDRIPRGPVRAGLRALWEPAKQAVGLLPAEIQREVGINPTGEAPGDDWPVSRDNFWISLWMLIVHRLARTPLPGSSLRVDELPGHFEGRALPAGAVAYRLWPDVFAASASALAIARILAQDAPKKDRGDMGRRYSEHMEGRAEATYVEVRDALHEGRDVEDVTIRGSVRLANFYRTTMGLPGTLGTTGKGDGGRVIWRERP